MAQSSALYSPDADHLWNRVHRALLIRRDVHGAEYGADVPEPLLWFQTKHLLYGDSHRDAVRSLDDFLEAHAENRIRDPIRRAILQHDLWAVFDWAAMRRSPGERTPSDLLARLARVMRRVALTQQEIDSLPDSYADAVSSRRFAFQYDPIHPDRPFLPPDLFLADGPWVPLSSFAANPTAIGHFTGRSRFLVFMRLPAGREQTLAYVRRLRASCEPPLIEERPNFDVLNLEVPQFPAGTAVALVRQMLLVDADGTIVPASITESVQIRVYHSVTPGTRFVNHHNGPAAHDQDFYEFRMSRPALFARDGGGLTAARPNDMEYPVVFSFGVDPFESHDAPFIRLTPVLGACRACHSDSGIHSVQSRLRWMNSQTSEFSLNRVMEWETAKTVALKREKPELRLLRRLWQ